MARAPSRSFGDISPTGESRPGDAGSRAKLVPEGHGDVPWATSAPTSSLSLPDDPSAFARTEPSRAAAPGPSLLGGAMERPLPSRRPSGDLPPELLGAARPEGVVTEYGPGESSSSTLTRVLLVLAVLAGLGLAGYLAYPAFRDRNTAMPAEAVAQKDRAVALLRRDDSASREQAIQALQSLSATHPKYAEAQAELAVALTLQLGDLNADFDRLRLQSDPLQREMDQLTAKHPEGWRDRADGLRDQVRDLEREQQPLRVSIEALRKRLDPLMVAVRTAPEVEPAATVAARLKAQALYASVTGHADALALAERLRQVESAAAWSRLAHAEFALSSGSPGATLQTVSQELEALRSEDPGLMRAYVLGARLALRQNDATTARTLLDELLALNGKHELARRMLAQLPADRSSP
ncbi:lipopolysaccharide assembly protein LapB [Corallococcus sp. CA053C]|uniref:tetratricopeptide repeat protein n=1 Tax=Corallococcus sp. CA053C TaxID=2316732 RepID=UPI001F3DBC6C|nr:hypothetical protein [Corallococcus sp. CA053C]